MAKTYDIYRSLSLPIANDSGKPASLNEEDRSVEVLATTENPAAVYDWDRGMVDEVLLMSGLKMPAGKQVPLLDTHSRYSTASVIGSFRQMAITKDGLVGRAYFSSVAEADGPYTKVAEGHLTDFSVGYRYATKDYTWIPEGETQKVQGKSYTGPLKVVTRWQLKELSVCPIGADELAKARADNKAPAPQHKENLMDPKLRAFLERHGLRKEATEEEATAFFAKMNMDEMAPAEKPTVPAGLSAEEARAAADLAVRQERERSSEITALCEKHGCRALAPTLIGDGRSVDQARQSVLEELAKNPGPAGYGHRSPATVGVEDRDKFRAASQDALMLRSGHQVEKPAAGHDELAGRSMVEMCRMSLVRSGQSDAGRPLEVVGRALMSSDMPVILGGTANLSLMMGYEAAGETWAEWCATAPISNFLTHKSARASEGEDLDEIPDGGEYEYEERTEAFESYQIATYGKIFAITRQAIINDDIGALTAIPFSHGEAAARKVGDVVYAVLTANSAMGDGVALFHSTHNNLGTSGVLTEITMGEGIKLMGLQKDIAGKRRLNLSPQFHIAPKTLEGTHEAFFSSNQFVGAATDATRTNIYAGPKYKRVYDSRLDDTSTSAWYLAGPKGKTIKVFFLDGVQKPYMEQRTGWSVDGIEHKVRIDAGSKAMDYRSLVKNAG
jgi:hypothetical protein